MGMRPKTKIWVAASLSAALLAGAGSAFAATANPSSTASNAPVQTKAQHHKGKEFGGYGVLHNAELLSLLKMDAASLKKALQSGQSLAEIAASKSINEQQVIDLLTNQMKQKLADQVKSGKLTQAQADQRSTKMAQQIKRMVEHKEIRHQHAKHPHSKGFVNNPQLLALLKMDAATLRSQLQSGQSLADIAASKNVSKQQVIDLLTNQMKQRLADQVKAGKLTQAQADQRSSKLADRVKQIVDHKGGFGKKGQHHQKAASKSSQTNS